MNEPLMPWEKMDNFLKDLAYILKEHNASFFAEYDVVTENSYLFVSCGSNDCIDFINYDSIDALISQRQG